MLDSIKEFQIKVERSYRKQLFAFILFSLCLIPAVHADSPRDPYQYFFNETWGDFQEELQNSRDQNKKAVLLFFEMDECPFCQFMKETILNQPKVQAYFRQHFLNFSVDIEGDVEIADFKGKPMTQKHFANKLNRVRATPVFAFYDLDGKKIARFTGRTSGVDEFMLLGQYVVDKEFEKMSFLKYKRMMKAVNKDKARPS